MTRSSGPREHQAQLEKLMLAAGGIAGPGSIGMQPAEPVEAAAS